MRFPPFLVVRPSTREQFFKMPRSNTPIAILHDLWADDEEKKQTLAYTQLYLFGSVRMFIWKRLAHSNSMLA